MVYKYYGVFELLKRDPITYISNVPYSQNEEHIQVKLASSVLYNEEEDAIEYLNTINKLSMFTIMPVYVTGLNEESDD